MTLRLKKYYNNDIYVDGLPVLSVTFCRYACGDNVDEKQCWNKSPALMFLRWIFETIFLTIYNDILEQLQEF